MLTFCLRTVDGAAAIELMMVGETDSDLKIGVERQFAYECKVVKRFLKKKKWDKTWLGYVKMRL